MEFEEKSLMNDQLEILFIDDEYSNWLPILEPTGNSFGFHITSAQSVEEGLEMLRKYPGMFDAVILDLSFPDAALQGKDGLLRVRESDRFLPVLILTRSSSTEHIRTAVECVRLGAYDYFPKNTLDPQQLFIQARNAIEQSRRYRCHMGFADVALRKPIKPYLHVSINNKGQFTSSFAFELAAIAIPRNKDEQDATAKLALDWHRRFLTYLSYLAPSVTITLRYIFSPPQRQQKGRLHIAVIVSLEETTHDGAARKSDLISNELSIFLHSNLQSTSFVYAFFPISSERELLNILKPLTPTAVIRITRRSVRRKTSDIGFKSGEPESASACMFPSLPLQNTSSTLHNFCSQLLKQQSVTVLDCSIHSTKFSKQEMDIIQDINKGNIVDQIDLPLEGIEQLVAYSAHMIEHARQCFIADLQLKQESNAIPISLVSSLVGELFGDASKADVQENVSEELVPEKRFPNLFVLEEATNVFRLPFPVIGGIPGIPSTHPAYTFIPEPLAITGPVLGIKGLGDRTPIIMIDPQDLRRHVYILGQTGTGKTTLLYSMIRERIEAGSGIGLIDPHGDLWNEIYKSIPHERMNDTIVFDPTDPGSAPGFNMLEYDPRFPEQKTFLIQEMFSIFWQLYDFNLTAGPVFEYYMRNAMLLVMDNAQNPGTLLDVVKVFQDTEFRKELIRQCKDQLVIDVWTNEIDKVGGDCALRNMSPYITSKLNMFIQNHYVLPIVSKRQSEIDFRNVIDNKKILLVKLTRGKLGSINVKLFGTILFAKLLMAALSRENIPESSRQDFTLFVDEFQNFTSDSIADALSEARKYRLSLVLANQTLGQLKEQILTSVLGNVGSLIFFRPGVEDMPKIEPYVSPPFTKEEMLNLPNFTAVARLQVNNAPTRPFMFETLPPEVLKRE